jgi:NAD(P)-dependent dehydrogenase (short-subunit alcohol dehydrogenase family)
MRGASDIIDPRVTPLTLDVTDASQIEEAVAKVDTLDVLINNAGIALFDDLSDPKIVAQHLAVNFSGRLNVINAFLPLLKRSKGAIVNNVSTMALAPFPVTPAYAISKAAAFNMTQSLRALLAAQGVKRSCGPDRPHGHRYDQRLRNTEGLSGVRRARHLRRS